MSTNKKQKYFPPIKILDDNFRDKIFKDISLFCWKGGWAKKNLRGGKKILQWVTNWDFCGETMDDWKGSRCGWTYWILHIVLLEMTKKVADVLQNKVGEELGELGDLCDGFT